MNTKIFASLWLSRIIFRVLDQVCKKLYRKLERITIKQIIDRDTVGVSLAGKHTNCLTYFSIPRYLSQQELGVWRVVGGGCGQGAPKWGPKNGLAHAKSIPLEITLDFMMSVICIIRI